MKKTMIAAAIALVAAPAFADEKAELMAEGKALMMQFGGALKAELLAAVEAGGPVQAISVCNERAPEIAMVMSEESGWELARSSHRLRNPANQPDDFTAAVIAEFLEREAAGETPDTLAKAAIVEEDGERMFRMVKAIGTAPLCLNCHGATLAAPVEAALADIYPDDEARGFEAGQMRGVFTLIKPLD